PSPCSGYARGGSFRSSSTPLTAGRSCVARPSSSSSAAPRSAHLTSSRFSDGGRRSALFLFFASPHQGRRQGDLRAAGLAERGFLVADLVPAGPDEEPGARRRPRERIAAHIALIGACPTSSRPRLEVGLERYLILER